MHGLKSLLIKLSAACFLLSGMLAPAQAESFRKHYGTRNQRIRLLPPGISRDRRAPRPSGRRATACAPRPRAAARAPAAALLRVVQRSHRGRLPAPAA